MPDSTTPIIVGVAQVEQRISDPSAAREPIELMADALTNAADDAGNPTLIQQAQSIRVVRGLWPYQDPAAELAARFGTGNVETGLTPLGGNGVQRVVNASALDIVAGTRDLILITGAECGKTQANAAKQRVELDWTPAPGTPDVLFGKDLFMSAQEERVRDIKRAIQVYPMFELALRHHLGESPRAHLERVSELWAGFSQVAATNPNAWLREPVSAATIRTVGPANRAVSHPYPKFMNSNNSVDQGAALIMCSVAKARSLGIPEDRWVYPWTGTDGHDTIYVSQRDNLYSSPAIRIAGGRALALADLSADALDFVDVYSCFPSAVQIAARELGLDTARSLTVTGGLTFAGGPLNNYVMHAIATMVARLRERPGTRGLVTANGGFLTKHAFGVYSAAPPAKPFQYQDVQPELDRLPQRASVADHRGLATVEAYTVMYGPTGPRIGHCACLTDDGQRTWANTTDADSLASMIEEEFCGRTGRIDGAGTIAF